MGRPDPFIPRGALRMGVLTCLSVASSRLEETDVLLSHGLLTQAAVLFSFALEEFGKAVLLRKAYESGADLASIEGFYDHRTKIEAAATRIDPKHLRIAQGAFDADAFDSGGLDTGRKIDLSTRLSGLYVDWKDDWIYGVHVDAEVLRQSSKALQLAVSRASAAWT